MISFLAGSILSSREKKSQSTHQSFNGNKQVAELLMSLDLSVSKEDSLSIIRELCQSGDLFSNPPEKLDKELKFGSGTNVAYSKRVMALRLHDDHDPLEIDEMGRVCRILDQRASRKRLCRTNMY